MTSDVIALTATMPDAWSLVAGLAAAGPEPRVTQPEAARGAVIQLHDAEGRPLVSVEAPLLVHHPGEAERLLGVTVPGPVWWTEIRAATTSERGRELAGTIATRLVRLLGGTVWPPDAAAPDAGAAPVSGVTAAAPPAAAQPAVDVLTQKVAAVIQDRPLVAMTAWLSDALRAARADGRALQLVTPPGARLTLPTRAALAGLPNRWVVRDGDGGYYDGLSGVELRWADGAFTPVTGQVSPAYVAATRQAAPGRAAGGPGHQLLLSFVTRLPAADDTVLGGALEAAWRRLTGTAGPVAWGTAEPATRPWSRRELTDLARGRAPDPTWFVAVGEAGRADAAHDATDRAMDGATNGATGGDAAARGRAAGRGIATLRVTRTSGGVEEDVTLALAGRPPHEATLHALATELVNRHGLVSLLVQRRRARADLTVPAHLEAPPVPLAFVLGEDGVADAGGREHAAHPPRPLPAPRRVGRGLCFALPEEAGWEGFQRLMGHLHQAGRARRAEEAG